MKEVGTWKTSQNWLQVLPSFSQDFKSGFYSGHVFPGNVSSWCVFHNFHSKEWNPQLGCRFYSASAFLFIPLVQGRLALLFPRTYIYVCMVFSSPTLRVPSKGLILGWTLCRVHPIHLHVRSPMVSMMGLGLLTMSPHLPSLCSVAHQAFTLFCHLTLSAARCRTSDQDFQPAASLSFSLFVTKSADPLLTMCNNIIVATI